MEALKKEKSTNWLYGLAVGILIAINVIPLAVEYFTIMKGFKSYFVDFHLKDQAGHRHAGFIGQGMIPVADGEIAQYAYETPELSQITANRRIVDRAKPDALGFHWGDRGFLWSDFLRFSPPQKLVKEGTRYGLKIEREDMPEVMAPGAPWDSISPHISFLGKFPSYKVNMETDYFKFDLEYKPRSIGWHLSNNSEKIRAGDFGIVHMNELPCNVSGSITHKKNNSVYQVTGYGFMEDSNGTMNWFEWGGHHYFTSHFPNGWAVSFWAADEDWQWGNTHSPVEVWVYDADRKQFYNAHEVKMLSMHWDRERINGMDFAKDYHFRALTNAGVVELTAKSISFKPILGEVKFVPWDVKMAYSKGTMNGFFTYLDGSTVKLEDGVGTLENFQRYMPNMIYITPWSLILLVLLIGGRRIIRNREENKPVKATIWYMLAWMGAVILLTIVWL